MNLPPLTFQYPREQLFRHTDGGYYRYLMAAYSSADQSEKIIYEHLWPFEPSIWERPVAEFSARFCPVTAEDLKVAMQRDRTTVQEEIAQAKKQRRAGQEK